MKSRPLLTVWKVMGLWRWLMLAPVLICLGITPYAMQPTPQWRDWGARQVSGSEVTLQTRGHFRPGESVEVRLTGLDSVLEVVKLQIPGTDGQVITAADMVMQGERRMVSTHLVLPHQLADELVIDFAQPGATGRILASWQIGRLLPR